MNLTDNDKRLFEILDWEIDKSLSFGCYLDADFTDCWCEENIQIDIAISWFWTRWIQCLNNWNTDNHTILWHYPTHADVLRYCKKTEYNYPELEDSFIRISSVSDFEWFELDLTKTIQNYSEEQKQELINFLETIK